MENSFQNNFDNSFKLRALVKIKIVDNSNFFESIPPFNQIYEKIEKESFINNEYKKLVIKFLSDELKIKNIIEDPINDIGKNIDNFGAEKKSYYEQGNLFKFRVVEMLDNIKKADSNSNSSGSFTAIEFKLRYVCSFFLKDSKAMVLCIARDQNTLELRFLSNSIVSLYKGCSELVKKIHKYNEVNLRTLFTLNAIFSLFNNFKGVKSIFKRDFWRNIFKNKTPEKLFFKIITLLFFNYTLFLAISIIFKIACWIDDKVHANLDNDVIIFFSVKSTIFEIGNFNNIFQFINLGIWVLFTWQVLQFITSLFDEQLGYVLKRNKIEFVNNKIAIREPSKDDDTIEGTIIESPIKYIILENTVNIWVGFGAIVVFLLLKFLKLLQQPLVANTALYITLITNWTPLIVNYIKFITYKKERIIWKTKTV